MREENAVIVARRLPVRFDVAVSAAFPDARALRLAHQVRQDLWRTLKDVTGFSPVVRVERTGSGLRVTAGGAIACPFPKPQAEERIEALLQNACARARWLAHARKDTP
jgi:hypothetical protein